MEERIKAPDILSREEIAALTQPSNWAGARAVFGTWAIIGATLFLLARFPHPLTFVAAVIILGGRQLALAILMHEAAHRHLFRTRALNDWLGDVLCARAVWGHLEPYRTHHLAHHAWAGSERDPDRYLSAPFPIARASLVRKFARDLVGISGARRALGLLLMDLEILKYDVSGHAVRQSNGPRGLARLRGFARNLGPMVIVNAALFALLALLGHGWVYSAWAVAWLTTYGLFLRIRSFAEHACTEASADPLRNTRTTHAGFLARMTVAPVQVNFHLEHHLLASVPWFRLPQLHRMLKDRGALEGAALAPDYASVLAIVTRANP
jgi:fatty acid desaturase